MASSLNVERVTKMTNRKLVYLGILSFVYATETSTHD